MFFWFLFFTETEGTSQKTRRPESVLLQSVRGRSQNVCCLVWFLNITAFLDLEERKPSVVERISKQKSSFVDYNDDHDYIREDNSNHDHNAVQMMIVMIIKVIMITMGKTIANDDQGAVQIRR